MQEVEQLVVSPGNGSRYWLVLGKGANGDPFVALPDFGVAATMAYDWFVAESYASEKLGSGLSDADIKAVCKILNDRLKPRGYQNPL